jgi:hypothetical protein
MIRGLSGTRRYIRLGSPISEVMSCNTFRHPSPLASAMPCFFPVKIERRPRRRRCGARRALPLLSRRVVFFRKGLVLPPPTMENIMKLLKLSALVACAAALQAGSRKWAMRLLSAALVACFSACAALPQAPGDPAMILADEIGACDARNAYEVVERLRPRWLRGGRSHSTRLDTVILVYYDGIRLGGLEALRDLPVEHVRHIRVVGSAEAGMLPGLGSQHVERAIMVASRQLR